MPGYLVKLPYLRAQQAVDWAKNNTPSYITNTVVFDDDTFEPDMFIAFHFSEEKDATMFTLRWK